MSNDELPNVIDDALNKKFIELKLERMKQAGISPLPLKKDTTEIAGQNISKALKQNAAKPVNQNATKQAETAVVPGGRISAGMSQLKQRYDEKNDEDNADAISPEERSLLQKIVRKGLVNNRYDVEIQQKNPNSPLYSVKSFESLNLRRELIKGIYEMGFNIPSKIQETALPTLLADPPQNMIAQSQSGTGKTATFLLTMISRIDPSKNYPQALCICPTFELAVQIGEQVSRMCKYYKEIMVALGVRGEEANKELLESHVVIGTPGKMLDLSVRLKRIALRKVRVFVLDEADIMINTQGYQEQTIRIMKGLSNDCQIMLFSATYEHHLMKFAEGMIPDPIIIKLRKEEETLENIKQFYVRAENIDDKFEVIRNVYSTLTIGQSMVFCQTKKKADELAKKMKEGGFLVGMLTGDLSTDERINVLDEFRDMKYNSLITTNVLARGIDIESVALVINFDIPRDGKGATDYETYLHRIGRTGRFGKDGVAINIIESDQDYKRLLSIEEHFGIQIKQLNVYNLDELEEIGT